jgi:murein DD-endopeptidase MepM/ murein hydrolase activator NlpD
MPATTRPKAPVRILSSTLRPKRMRSRRSSLTPPQRPPAPRRREKLWRIRPSAPSLLGSAALALATVGAIASMQGAQPAPQPHLASSMQTRMLDSPTTERSSDALTTRQGRVSRDSQRAALESTSQADLPSPTDVQDQKRGAALAAQRAAQTRNTAKRAAEKRASAERAAEKRAAEKRAAEAWRSPIAPGSYELTARFGQCSGLWSQCHTGLDFAAPTGTPIRSVATGTVTKVGYAGAYGLRTIVRLDDGTKVSYSHQNSTSVVPRQKVDPGDRIGTVGATGNATGPHLHLEVHRRGKGPVDPHATLIAHNVRP